MGWEFLASEYLHLGAVPLIVTGIIVLCGEHDKPKVPQWLTQDHSPAPKAQAVVHSLIHMVTDSWPFTSPQFEFTKVIEDQHVKENEFAVFECTVTKKKIPVQWFVHGVEVEPGPKYQVCIRVVNIKITFSCSVKGSMMNSSRV